MKKLLSAVCSLVACHAALAGDSRALPAASSAAAKNSARPGPIVDTKPAAGNADAAKVYVIGKKSPFTASAGDHNPFWPIGWMKTESLSGAAASLIPHSENFIVTSILLNEPPMAVINGKEMAEGEVAAVTVDGQSVMVQLMAVQDGRVILRWQNQNIIVPLHRDETLSPTDTNPPVASR